MELYDVVALKNAFPQYGLEKGQQGTIVEVYNEKYVEVEFCNFIGITIFLGAFFKSNLELIWLSKINLYEKNQR